MSFDIGPNLAGILTSVVSIAAGVVALWLKQSKDHADTNANVDALHAKVDAMTGGTATPPTAPPP